MLKDNEDFKLVEESFPHIANKLELMWGNKECYDFLNNLFLDTRDGKRQGFPKPIASALHRISTLHDEQYPQYVKNGDIWINSR